MPSKLAPPSTRENGATSASTLISSHHCPLPVWDDAQIAQENWGCLLSATASTGNGGEANAEAGRQGSVKLKSSGGQPSSGGHSAGAGAGTESHFEDSVGHQCVADFIHACQAQRAPSSSSAPGSNGTIAEDEKVSWKRPVDIFRPFRPVVHRNATPFVNPYAAEEELTPTEAKAEEEAGRAPSSTGGLAGSAGGNKKSTASAARNTEGNAAVTETFHQQYPEAVTVLEDFVGDDVTRWSHCSSIDAVRHYRALPTLMQPYDGALIAGCAETPAEACGSRYSTTLRHKLKQAEQLSALTEAPPFLMTALDSALLAVEQAQRYIPAGVYLWELVYPHAPGTCHPVYNPFGKYAVKLFVAGVYRKVIVDDRLPVDVLGRPLLTTTSLKELWPALIGKAIVKAFGPVTGVQALATSPDLVVSALLGNWVPQYLSPRHDTVSTMTTLLLYERLLKKLSHIHAPLLPDASAASVKKGDNAAEEGESAVKKDGKSIGNNTAGGGGAQTTRRRSSAQQKRGTSSAKAEAGSADAGHGDPQRLVAFEYCAATVDEPIPEQTMYICGLYAPSASAGGAVLGAGGAAPAYQLLTIHAIKPFRNTFALLLHTTPRIQLAAGVFEKEKDADDVSALLRWVQHQASSPSKALAMSCSGGDHVAESQPTTTEMVIVDSTRSPSVTSCWLTLEEFMAQMAQVVVWRVLEGKLAHTKSVTGEAVLQHHGLGTSPDTANPIVDAAAPVGKQSSPPGGQKGASPLRDEAPAAPHSSATGASQLPLSRGKGAGAGLQEAPYASALSQTCVWWKLTATTAVEAVVVVSCPTLTEATLKACSASTNGVVGGAGGDASMLSPQDVLAMRERRLDLHHFQWDRAEPLNHVGSVTYSDGALRFTALRLRPGTHLLRVNLHNLQPADTIAFLSDVAMEVQLSLTHDFAQDGFASVTDAGTYPSMSMHDVEYIWLKRVFTLAKPTTLTVVLSTLDDTEDVAAHRRVNTVTQRASAAAAPVTKTSQHGKGGAPPPTTRGGGGAATAGAAGGSSSTSTAVAGSTKKNSSVSPPEGSKEGHIVALQPTEEAEASAEPAGVAILRFTKVLLVNLDNPEDFRVGSAGRLVQLRLEPNEKGYLVIAYTSVPTSPDTITARPPLVDAQEDRDSPLSNAGLVPPPSTHAVEQAFTSQNALAVASAAPLFRAGLWKLTLRSDAELQAFETVAHNNHDVVVEADLPRGGSSVLFRRTCSVAEPTHLSLIAQLRTPLPMTYTVRVTRPGSPTDAELQSAVLPGAAGAKGAVGISSAMSPVSTSESPFTAEDGAANARTIFESDATEGRLFVADVLLPYTQESSNAKTAKAAGGVAAVGGGSGAPTTYIIEASVSQAGATAWNDQCLRHQESVFAQVRGRAEVRAAALRQSEVEEFQQDPYGFLQRKKEFDMQRRQQLTEAAEKTVTHTQGDSAAADARGPRARSSSTSRRQSRRVSSAVDSFVKDTCRRMSSVLDDGESEAATLAVLDATDPAAMVHLTAQLSFSSTRVELKEEAPAFDPVAELRQHMRETMAWLQDRLGGGGAARVARNGVTSAGAGGPASGSASGATAATTSASGNTKSQAPRNQRDGAAAAALSVEDALHAKAARQSRLTYLRNPQHIFHPSFEVIEVHPEPTAMTPSAGTPSTAALNPSRSKPHDSATSSTPHTFNSSFGASGLRGGHKESLGAAATAARLPSIGSDTTPHLAAPARGPEVVLHDGPATRFRYAAPLTPSQYRVELLPLRSYEESMSTMTGRDKDAALAGGAGGGNANAKRPKASSTGAAATSGAGKGGGSAAAAALTGSGSAASAAVGGAAGSGGGNGSGGGGVSLVGSSTLSYPLTTAECDGLVWPLQAPLLEAMKVWDSATAATRQPRGEHRFKFRASFQTYFEAVAAQRATAVSQTGPDMLEATAKPVIYHSLLGIKEEDMGTSVRSKKSTVSP